MTRRPLRTARVDGRCRAARPAARQGAGHAWRRSSRATTCSRWSNAATCRSTASRRGGGAQAARRPAAAAGTGAHRGEPGLQAAADGAGHRLRGRASAGARQAGRPGGAPGGGQLVRHLAERPAGPPCRGGHAAACRHRAPARQGHLRPDGGGQDPAGRDRAVARHRRARGAPPLPGAGAWPRALGPRRASTRPSAAIRCRASAWPCWPRASRRAPTCIAWPAAAACSALACKLHTGRTHQIRVHLAWLGHPLVSDALYGGAPALGLQRQALHAARLRLQHPVSGAWLDFECRAAGGLRPGLGTGHARLKPARRPAALQCHCNWRCARVRQTDPGRIFPPSIRRQGAGLSTVE